MSGRLHAPTRKSREHAPNVQAGGAVASGTGSIGDQAGSIGTVTVTGANSSWDLGSGGLNVGTAGSGTLTISNGGTLTSGEVNIGFQAGSTGTVTVTGASSTWNLETEGLYVGFLATGTLTISDGGTDQREVE